MMKEVDYQAAAEALINWFRTQELMPADAAMVMSRVMAEQLVIKTRDIAELTKAANLTRGLLLLDIAEWLRK